MDLSHLLEEPDIHERYLERWRAERLAKTMWQLTQGHTSWRGVSTAAPLGAGSDAGGGGGVSGGAGFSESTPAYLEFKVPSVDALEFGGETWRIWQRHYADAFRTLTLVQQEAWQEHVLRNRYSAVFAVLPRHAMVRRVGSASPELAEAALKLLNVCEK